LLEIARTCLLQLIELLSFLEFLGLLIVFGLLLFDLLLQLDNILILFCHHFKIFLLFPSLALEVLLETHAV